MNRVETVSPSAGSLSLRSRQLRLVHHPGPPGRLLERVPDLGVEGRQGLADGFFRHPGARQVHAVEAAGVLADGRAAADAHVLGDRPDEVHRAVDVEGGPRQHAVQRLAGEPGRVASPQVDQAQVDDGW